MGLEGPGSTVVSPARTSTHEPFILAARRAGMAGGIQKTVEVEAVPINTFVAIRDQAARDLFGVEYFTLTLS